MASIGACFALAVGELPARAAPPLEPAPLPQSVSQGADYGEARELMTKKKWAEAAIVLKKIVKSAPDDAAAAWDLARSLVNSGRREEALSALAASGARASPSRRKEIARRARVVSRQFLTHAAAQAFEEGMGLLRAGKSRAARSSLEKALSSEPDNVEVLVRLGQAAALEADYDSASERLRLARKLNPHEPQARLWLGRSLHQRGELGAAITELREAVRELADVPAAAAGPAHEQAVLWLSEALASSGQRSAALKTLEDGVKARPGDLMAALAIARMRFAWAARDPAALQSIRKSVLGIQSGLDAYLGARLAPEHEADFAIDLRKDSEVKGEVAAFLQAVDARIEDREPAG